MRLTTWLTLELRDKDGRLVRKPRRIKGNSLVHGFGRGLACMIAPGIAWPPGVDRNGVSFNYNTAYFFCYPYNPSSDQGGLVIGTGNNPVTMADYNLQASIAHGNGAGQLYYNTHANQNIIETLSSITLTFTRSFTNNSAGAIIAREVGLVSYAVDSLGSGRLHLFARDLIGDYTILPGQTLTAVYSIEASLT